MNLIFDNQLSIFEDIFYKYLTPKQCTKLYTSNLILYNIFINNDYFEDYYYTPKDSYELAYAVDKWCKNKDEAILKYGDINYWNTIYIINMTYLFKDKCKFNDNISDWNVSNVTNMRYMFYNTPIFNQNLNNWNINNSCDMSFMFYYARKFNIRPNWNIDNCITIQMYVGSAIK